MKFRFPAFFLVVVLFAFSACKNKEADVLLINGIIHTLDAENTVVQALAIKDGKVVARGRTDELQFLYKADSVFDLRGNHVYPGLIDAHCHFYGYAMALNKVNLVGTTSWEEVVSQTKAFANDGGDSWVQGRGWDQTNWKDQQFPSKKLLDEAFPDRPVILRRIGGHSAIVNSKALELAGITGKTKIHGGQVILRNGSPTGMLIDNAVDSVLAVIPQPTNEEIAAALLMAEKNIFAVGLTTVDDAGLDLRIINLIDSMQQNGLLKLRVYAMANPTEENFDRFLDKGPYKTERLSVTSFKVYGDGALGSRGACMLRPYKDLPGHYGSLLQPPSYYKEIAKRIYDAGFQMNTHCIGDSANRMILRIYGDLLKGENDRRWRIEHAQIVDTNDFYRFKQYDIWPSVNPVHAMSDYNWAEDRVGKARLKGAYAYKTLFSQNNYIAFGSDFPVEHINPLLGYHAAISRLDLEGNPYGGYMKWEAVGRDTALKAMTIWPAIANFEEKEKGSLEIGKYADMVIFKQDILSIEEKDIPYVRLMHTIVNGEIVFSSHH